jgi:hypothetical protein
LNSDLKQRPKTNGAARGTVTYSPFVRLLLKNAASFHVCNELGLRHGVG